MGKMLADAGHDVRVYCEMLSPVDLEDCLGADLVGISSTTATSLDAYRLADILADAGVPVVFGGPHVTFQPDEALGHAPFVVRGEGEATILELVTAIERGAPFDSILGLSHRSGGGEAIHNPARPRCSQQEFERLPIPDLTLIDGYGRMKTKPIMTQWGCPFDCEFCGVTAMFSRAVRHRRVDQVIEELAGLEAEQVFFHDDNFVVNKSRSAGLLNAMLETGNTPRWFAQVRSETALRSLARPEVDEDFLNLMHRAGCHMVMIGIEAITDEGLAEIGKRQRVTMIEQAVRAFHDHGIAVHGMFIAGLDTDNAGSAEAIAAFARRLHIDTFQLMVETPLPGTRLWERIAEEDRLLSDDWSLFDGHHVVMQPAQMTPLELQLGVLKAMRRFYSWPTIVSGGVAGVLRHLPSFTAAARPAFIGRLPTLARVAWAQRWEEVAPTLRAALSEKVRGRVSSAMWLPALRFYARRQLAAWSAEERSRAYLARLASGT
jgi:radical SAM superfamily enzyme YgiQ (UPF0313 family)